MGTLDVNRDWKTVLSYLPENYRELAQQHKQLRVQYGAHVRITTAEDLLRLILGHVGADLPLRQTVALVAEGGGPSVSPNSLHMKMRKAAPYLQSLIAGMTSWTSECEPEKWAGYDLIAADGSSFAGRCATGTDARIHAALRLSDLSVFAAHATDVSVGESLRRFHWLPGQLVLVDRGYSNAPGIVHVVDRHADVLVRLNRGALPLFDREDESFDVEAFLRTIREEQVVEQNVRVRVWINRHLRIVDGRLIATRLPADKAAEARERVRMELGPDVSDEMLEMAAYVAVFTTVPKSRLTGQRCLEAYRLRWQIELLFKRWKSLCHFDRLPNERADTIVSWLCAKILLGLVVDRIAAAAPALFPPVQLASATNGRGERAPAHGRRPVENHEHHLARARRGATPSLAT
jgi:hypothetical protein